MFSVHYAYHRGHPLDWTHYTHYVKLLFPGLHRTPNPEYHLKYNHAVGEVCLLSRSVMSSSLRPHGPSPTRLLCSWDFSTQEYWSGLPFPTPGELPNPGTEPVSLGFPAWAGGIFTTAPPGKPSEEYLSIIYSQTSKEQGLILVIAFNL